MQTEMNDLEARLASAGDPALIALLDRRTVQAAALQDSLTITTSTSRALDPKRRDDGTVDDLVAFVPAPSFEQWLVVETRLVFARPGLEDEAVRPSLNVMLDREGVAAGRPIVGRRGYTINVSVDARMDRLLGCAADAEPAPCSPLDRSEATVRGGRDLVYLRPVPAAASLTPVAEDCKVMRCPEGWGREATTGTSTTLPQLSRLQMVPTGSGSIFGKRTVAAEFDPLGEPISLQYDKGGDAQNTATVVDAVNAVAPNVFDSRLTATKRRLDEEKTKADLVAILEAQLDRS
ncbi:hypothetical protein [Sphingomonas sp. CFBP 8765]|uniref:hypothetical protein n=1 Tax=Sphingomonas sp. CFBP 8765 TaxID=2775274 RepID=UPI001780D41B|nr:hypothetical protein [Sphingomonas sp. CFBP 8765]MBD8469210.1 hypothetical protein [Sphingomonas sp. CFBP 8765]